MSQDDIDNIPSIVPTREGVGGRTGNRPGGPSRRGDQRDGAQNSKTTKSGAGFFARLLITVSLVGGAVACAWAWQLQQTLEQAQVNLDDYENRIGELEARLSDTDEGMTQNATVQAAKIRELDSEVRKLWDNVWKSAGKRLDKLEASSSKHGNSIKSAQGSLSKVQGELKAASSDLAELQSVAGDMSRLMASAKASQAEVERVADTLNRINLDVSKLEKRVAGNEEWVASINAFRRQVNASLAEIQATARGSQGTAPTMP